MAPATPTAFATISASSPMGEAVRATADGRAIAAPNPCSAPCAREQALAVFEMEPPFTLVRLKARYKALVKLHHPDAHGGDRAAEEKLKIINQAYATLKASYFG